MRSIYYTLLLLMMLASACSGFEQSEKRRIRQCNEKEGKIFRLSGESLFSFAPIERKELEIYPWEVRESLEFPRITKEFFRCHGSQHHPHKVVESENKEIEIYDCNGIDEHGLVMKGGKEYVHTCFLELLNMLQDTFHQRVVITSGHRCPKHDRFINGYGKEKVTSYQIGAAVDFYVEGQEENSYRVIEKVMNFFCRDKKSQFTKKGEDCWRNHEVIITLNPKTTPRNDDNLHPYPYITIELRYDREDKKPIVPTWRQAHYGYKRN